jgi:hypothetical protein
MGISGGPDIIRDSSLVLELDAADRNSYPGSGTNWYDLSGNNNSGYLINGPTFSSNNGGSIVFSSTNSQYINLGSTAMLNYTSGNFTFSYWVNFNTLTTNSGGQGPIVLYKGNFNTNGYYDQIGATGAITFVTNQPGVNQVSSTNTGIITTSSWYNITYARNGASVKIYVNGIDKTTTAATHINPGSSGNNFTLATYNTSIYGNFNLSNFLNYNRALSATEIAQNYNQLKSRFNL